MRSRAAEAALAAGAYAGLALWWLWPLPAAPAAHALLPKDPWVGYADYYLLLRVLAWGAHILPRNPSGFFDANVFHPTPDALALSEHLLGQQPLFAPVYWASGNAVLAANVLVFAVQVLSGLGAWALCRRFASAPAAVLAGVLFAFCPWRYETLQQFHLLGTQYLPLVALTADRCLEHGRRRDATLLAAATTLQLLSSVYLAFATVILLAAVVPLGLLRWRQRLDRRRLGRLALALAVPALALGATSLPYLRLRAAGAIPPFSEGASLAVEVAAAMVRRVLAAEGVGPLGYVLAIAAVVPPWRQARWPRALGLALGAIGLAFAYGPVISFGPYAVPGPYAWLAAWVPGVASLRVPVRFLVVTMVGLVLLAALGFERWTPPRLRAPVAMLALAVTLWSWSSAERHPLLPQAVGDAVPPAYRWLAVHGDGRPLVELPPAGFTTEARRMYFGTVHWLPLVGGYTAYPPPETARRRELMAALPDAGALDALVRETGAGWILVHTEFQAVAARWRGPLPPGVEPAARWPDALLFRVTGVPERSG